MAELSGVPGPEGLLELAPATVPEGSGAFSLAQLSPGQEARLILTELAPGDRDLLAALGLAVGSRFRICRAGDPWILQVRATRIGLADSVAHRLFAIPEPWP